MPHKRSKKGKKLDTQRAVELGYAPSTWDTDSAEVVRVPVEFAADTNAFVEGKQLHAIRANQAGSSSVHSLRDASVNAHAAGCTSRDELDKDDKVNKRANRARHVVTPTQLDWARREPGVSWADLHSQSDSDGAGSRQSCADGQSDSEVSEDSSSAGRSCDESSMVESGPYVTQEQLKTILRETIAFVVDGFSESQFKLGEAVREMREDLDGTREDMQMLRDRMDHVEHVLANKTAAIDGGSSSLDHDFKCEMVAKNAMLKDEIRYLEQRVGNLGDVMLNVSFKLVQNTSRSELLERQARCSDEAEVGAMREIAIPGSLVTLCGLDVHKELNGRLARVIACKKGGDLYEVDLLSSAGVSVRQFGIKCASILAPAVCPSCYNGLSSVNGCFGCGYGILPIDGSEMYKQKNRKKPRGGKKAKRKEQEKDENVCSEHAEAVCGVEPKGDTLLSNGLFEGQFVHHVGEVAGAMPWHNPASASEFDDCVSDLGALLCHSLAWCRCVLMAVRICQLSPVISQIQRR